MDISINLTAEQEKALLTQYTTVQEYAQHVIENRANRLIEQIVRAYADSLVGVTVDEQTEISKATAGKIIVNGNRLPGIVKGIIVRRASVKTMVEKIAAQVLAETDLVKAPIAK